MKNNTKTKILESATKLFAEKGYAATSIRIIAKDCNVNLASIAYHFTNKDGLYETVLHEQFKPILTIVDKANNISDLSMEKLQYYATEAYSFLKKNPSLASIMIAELGNPTATGVAIKKIYLVQLYRFIYSTIQDGIDSGEFRDDIEIPHIAAMFIGTLAFYFVIYQTQSQQLNFAITLEKDYLANSLSILFHGICNPNKKKH